MNQKELKELIELVSANRIAEIEMERAGFKLRIRTNFAPPEVGPGSVAQATPPPAAAIQFPSAPAPVAPPPSPASVTVETPSVPAAPPAPVAPEKLHVVTAPIVGTFYRSPSPTAKTFVEVGTRVQPGTVLCIIEAMKLMNEIESDVAGEVVEIYQANAEPVEFGQKLFGIRQD